MQSSNRLLSLAKHSNIFPSLEKLTIKNMPFLRIFGSDVGSFKTIYKVVKNAVSSPSIPEINSSFVVKSSNHACAIFSPLLNLLIPKCIEFGLPNKSRIILNKVSMLKKDY